MKKHLFKITAIALAAALLAAGCGSVNSSSAKPDASSAAVVSNTGQSSKTGTASAQTGTKSGTSAAAGKTGASDSQMKTNSEPLEAPSAAVDGYAEEVFYEPEMYDMTVDAAWPEVNFNTEEYDSIKENGFRSVLTSPLSTFAADVDTASYANLRRMLDWGYTIEEIPSGAVRAEEMINYFSYDYDGPKEGEPFGVNAQIADCPWNPQNKLLVLGLQTEAIDFSEAPDTNLVFLIDVSGSMDDPDKLPLLKEAFTMLAEQLGEKDRVSIVTYASANDVVLEGVSGDHTEKIVRAINNLEAGGSTNGGEGIVTAYELAEEFYIEGGNNRVIIASDGDFNVGITSESELYDLIRKEKEKGIFLSVLGFGYGNYSDARMETLADNGDGNYSYIDSVKEAKKVLVDELGANMFTVAKDVKLQIEFNPAYISEYRQIGYENRAMAAEDFDDDKKDGGEIGAGHSITVLYELVPADPEGSKKGGLKYQEQDLSVSAKESGEWLTLAVRYKEPDGEKSRLLEYPVSDESYTKRPSDDFRFAAAVAEFAMILNGSEYLAEGGMRHVKDVLDEIELTDEYKEEFVDLVYQVRG